jgi:hypothetical protein
MPRHRWSPLLLGALVFGAYAMTRTYAHSGDDIQWMMRVEQAVTGVTVPHPASTSSPHEAWSTPGGAALQPRYYLALPSTVLVLRGLGALGWSGPSIAPVQLLHALWGAVGIVWFFLAMRRVVGPRWSAVAAIGLSTSYAWWYYGTHADYPMAAQALSCLFLYALVRLLDARRNAFMTGAVLGAVAALALLYLETRIVLLAVGAIGLGTYAWLGERDHAHQGRAALGGYVAGVALTLALGVSIGAVVTRVAARDAAIVSNEWRAATYAGAGAHGFTLLDAPKALYGFAKSLVMYPALGDRDPHQLLADSGSVGRLAFAAWYGAVAVAAALPTVLIVLQWRALRRYRLLLIVLLAWGGLELPFLVYWEPSYVKWFGPALIPWWASVAILLAGGFLAHPVARRAFVTAVAAFIVVIGATNLLAGFAPAARLAAQRWQDVGAVLASRSSRNDLFVAAEYRPLDFYLPYFNQRRVVSAETASAAAGGDETRAAQVLRRLMRETADTGGRVFVYPCGEPPRPRVTALVDATSQRLEPVPLDGSAPAGFGVCEIRAAPQ